MILRILQLVFITLLTGIFPLNAYAQYDVKDSFYFMKDDGKFSAEEKDEEAEYILSLCNSGVFQSLYYDCACIAGAYRIKRDEDKLVPQNTLINTIYNDESFQCGDPVKIAGNTYKSCMDSSKVYRAREENNEKYCKCVSNKVAIEFTKKPLLKFKYIEKIKLNALLQCQIDIQQPQN